MAANLSNFQSLAKGESATATFTTADKPTVDLKALDAQDLKTRPIMAIGGHGSTINDPFFPFIKKLAPNARLMPLRGTGHGIAGLGVGNSLDQIKAALRTNDPATLYIGNSIGGPLLRKAISQVDPEGTNTQRQAIFIDPPNLGAYPFPVNPPRAFSWVSPTATLIKDQVRDGIMTDTNTISFTQGKWMNDFKHSPWINPNDPVNAANISNLTQTIKSKATVKPWPLPTGPN